MKRYCCVLVLLSSLCCLGEVPRIAIWDPVTQTPETRFQFDLQAVSNTCAVLNAGKCRAERLKADEIAQADRFSVQQYDALVLIGEALPRKILEPVKRFVEQGGVLISLNAAVPFLIGVSDAGGAWRLSPAEPPFAWQTDALLKLVGQKYIHKPELHSQGIVHTPSTLLRRYVPSAVTLEERLEGRWVVPVDGGEVIPLLLSSRSDKSIVPGGIYLARKGKSHALIATASVLTQGTDESLWPCWRETLVGLARMAKDLKDGHLSPPASDAVSFRDDLPVLALDRAGTRSVEPEGAVPLIRWGLFNGSILDTGPWVKSGETRVVKVDAKKDFPGALLPGACVRLELPAPQARETYYLRIRGAFLESSPVLRVEGAGRTLWNESLIYLSTQKAGNHSQNIAGMPNEFTRMVPLPAAGLREVTLANAGNATVFFDAAQVEARPKGAYERCIGLGIGQRELFGYSPELTKGLGGLRMSMRTQRLGLPDDPNRFALLDKLFNGTAAMNGVVQPILEGTPEWAAISPERLADAKEAKRPTTVPPNPDVYAEIVRDVARRYGKNIGCFEVWNEADITQFYRGSADEYATLFLKLVPVIRKEAPHAKIMPCGMAGYHEGFISTLYRRGIYAQADMIAFHPYAGKTAGWDIPYGLTEGSLLSKGIGLEIFCNESGFPFNNAEWFQPPPEWTEAVQQDYLNTAMARLLANGVSKVSVFNAGGDEHPYGLIDSKGRPRLAYEVIADYAKLQSQGATRLDVGLASTDAQPLCGIYAAGSQHRDGRMTVVINPAQCEALKPVVDLKLPLRSNLPWTSFFGQTKYLKDQDSVTVIPDAGKTAGFYKHIQLNVNNNPNLVIEGAGEWELFFKVDGKPYPVLPRAIREGARIDCRALLPKNFNGSLEISFRVYQPTEFKQIDFLTEKSNALNPQLVRLLVACPARAYTATATDRGHPPQTLAVQHKDGLAEITVPVTARTVVELAPR